MKVGIAKQQSRLRSKVFESSDVVANGGVAGDVNQLKLPAPFAQKLLHRQHERCVDRLNPPALQLFAVSPKPSQVGRQKGHLPAQALQQLHFHESGLAASITIWPGRSMVKHQGPAHDAAILMPFRLLTGGFPRRDQGMTPLLAKQRGVLALQAFDTGCVVGVDAGGGALVVHNPG